MDQSHEVAQLNADELRAAVKTAQDSGMSQAAIAREVGVSGTTISQWLNGRYQGDNDAVAAKIGAWNRNRLDAQASGRPVVPGWIATPTSKKVEKALAFAQSNATIALVHGDAGVGKTKAVEHYASENPNVWRVTAAPSTAGLMATLEAVADALDLRDIPNRPSTFSREIVGRLKGTRGLMIVDEAQHLATQSLEELRSIHDASGVGLALVGNERVADKFDGNRKAVFAQLFSRVGMRMGLKSVSTGDTNAILTAWGVTGAAERDYAHKIAILPGGLRGLMQTLRQAVLVARSDDQAVDVATMQRAWLSLGGES